MNVNQEIANIAMGVTRVYLEHGNVQRPGQISFNGLLRVHPNIAEKIRGTDCDPFHDCSKLEAFWDKVAELLTKESNS